MSINYWAVLVASIAQFVFSAIWYTPIFGKTWGRIHEFDKVSPEKQKEMMRNMWKPLSTQLIFTFVTTFVFALLINGFPSDWNIYGLAGFFWLGFILPTQVSAVIFGGTKPEWVMSKIGIMSGAALGNMLIIAAVFSLMAK
ncbi:MAG: DUF1761 domain-containing protein [Candidatus Doudnabacteria bacterium]|nr:DUF1761 domain-containing protein [Candidatus Doudnabacteria bacterium]